MFKIKDRKSYICKRELILMFVNFHTGFGKSLIYQAFPLIQCRYNLKGFWPYVVVVVSPLVNLMQEQVIHLRSLGISSVSLSNIEENELKYVARTILILF